MGKKNIGSSWGHSGNRLRLSAFDWNHFLPSNFYEIVNFHGPVKDNNALNDYTLWRMTLAMHLFLHECFCIYLVNKSETHWSGSEWWVLHWNFWLKWLTLLFLFGNHGHHLRHRRNKQYIIIFILFYSLQSVLCFLHYHLSQSEWFLFVNVLLCARVRRTRPNTLHSLIYGFECRWGSQTFYIR